MCAALLWQKCGRQHCVVPKKKKKKQKRAR